MARSGITAALFIGVVSIVPTRRRRFFWAAWWTEPPRVRPFRAPDASSGGALTREEARAQAERAASRALTEIDAHWAGAWRRVIAGKPPWTERFATGPGEKPPPRSNAQPPEPAVGSAAWAHATLSLGPTPTPDEIKRGYRAAALRTHPDRGGDEAAFIAAKRAHDVAMARATSPPKRKRRRRAR